MSDFSFDPSIAANATAELTAARASESAPEPTATPAVGQSADPVAAPVVESAPAKPSLSELPDDTLIPVEQPDGTVAQMKIGELRKGYLRQSDYTRKTQEVATARQELQKFSQNYQQMVAQQEQVQQFLNNREALQAYVKEKFEAGMPQYDPNDIATVEQAQTLIQAKMQQFKAEMAQELSKVQQATRQELQATAQAIRTQQESAGFAKEINKHLESIMETHPILGAVTNMEDVIRWNVLQMKPKDLAEAKVAFQKVAEEQAAKLTQKFTEINKAKVTNKEKLVAANIEPPGGTGVQPQPKSFVDKKTNAVNWKDLAASALAAVSK